MKRLLQWARLLKWALSAATGNFPTCVLIGHVFVPNTEQDMAVNDKEHELIIIVTHIR